MRHPCEFETDRVPVSGWRDDAAASDTSDTSGTARGQIDLDRVVWDPEYRSEVLESLRETG